MINILAFLIGGGMLFLIGTSIFFSLYSIGGSLAFIFKRNYPEVPVKTPSISKPPKKPKSKAPVVSEFGEEYQLPEFYWAD